MTFFIDEGVILLKKGMFFPYLFSALMPIHT